MVSLDEQLSLLGRAGIHPNPEVTIDQLRALTERDSTSLLRLFAQDENLSKDIWAFDAECISRPGSYVKVVRHIRDLSHGFLPLEEIQDKVDIYDEQIAWVAFQLNGKQYKWDLVVEDDWLDMTLLHRLAGLLADQDTSKRLVMCGLGQEGIIACTTPEELVILNSQQVYKFSPIEEY